MPVMRNKRLASTTGIVYIAKKIISTIVIEQLMISPPSNIAV
jgi:hypothetical protein